MTIDFQEWLLCSGQDVSDLPIKKLAGQRGIGSFGFDDTGDSGREFSTASI